MVSDEMTAPARAPEQGPFFYTYQASALPFATRDQESNSDRHAVRRVEHRLASGVTPGERQKASVVNSAQWSKLTRQEPRHVRTLVDLMLGDRAGGARPGWRGSNAPPRGAPSPFHRCERCSSQTVRNAMCE